MAERELTPEEKVQADINAALKGISSQSAETPALEGISIPADQSIQKPLSGLTQVKSESPETPKLAPETDIKGMTGAVTRGLTVPAVQSAAGMGVGAFLGPPGMAAGAAAGPIVFGLGDLAIEGINSYFGTDFATSRGAITYALDKLGTPKPDTAAERIVEAVTEGVSSGGGTAAGFKSAAEMAALAPELSKLKKVSEFMGARTGEKAAEKAAQSAGMTRLQKAQQILGSDVAEQTAVGGLVSAASSGAQEAGAGPVGSVGAGLLAALAIPAGKGVKSGIVGLKNIFKPSEAAKEAEALSYAKGVFQKVFPNEEERIKAIEAWKKSGESPEKYIQLMSGDISGQPGMVALQRALEKSSLDIAQRKSENIAGIAKKTGEALQDVGAAPEEATKFFEDQFNYLTQVTKDAEESLKLAGTGVTEEFNAAKQKVDDIKAKYEKGLLNAEDAHKKAKSALDDYFELENTKITNKRLGDISTQAGNIMESQRNVASEYATSLYNEVPNVDPFVQPKTKKAIDDLISSMPEGKGGRKDIHPTIEDIYANIVDENGNLKQKTLNDPVKLRQKLNDDIDIAIRSGKKQKARELQIVKEAIDADLQSLEKAYPQIKKANKFYKEYSDIYQSKLWEKAFKEGEPLTDILNKFSSSEEGLTNLRNSIIGHPEIPKTDSSIKLSNDGLAKVDEWIVSKAYEAMRKPGTDKKYTSASLKRWLNQGEGSVIFKVFGDDLPESRASIEELITKFEEKENAAIQAKKNIELTKAQELTEGTAAKEAYNKAQKSKQFVDETLEEERKQLIKDFKEKTDPSMNPANKFLGGRNTQEVIKSIMSQTQTSQEEMRKILEAASQDPSGKAVEGVKNAVRKWLNEDVRDKTKPTATTGFSDPVLLIDNLQVDLKKVADLLTKDSTKQGYAKRKALEVVFGENSKELAALDNVRNYLDMISRQSSLSAGDLAKLEDLKSNEIVDNLLSIGAIGFGQVKGYVAWKGLDLIRKLQQNTRADIGERMQKILAKGLVDPETAITLSDPITKENWPRIKGLLKNFGIQARATDFGLDEDAEKESEVKTKTGFGFAKQDNENKGGFPKL